jgi:hypothetical protein
VCDASCRVERRRQKQQQRLELKRRLVKPGRRWFGFRCDMQAIANLQHPLDPLKPGLREAAS